MKRTFCPVCNSSRVVERGPNDWRCRKCAVIFQVPLIDEGPIRHNAAVKVARVKTYSGSGKIAGPTYHRGSASWGPARRNTPL